MSENNDKEIGDIVSLNKTLNTMNKSEKSAGFLYRKMRSEVLFKSIMALIFASVTSAGWLFFYWKLFGIGSGYLIGIAVILSAFYMWVSSYLDKKVVCPACSHSLIFRHRSQSLPGWYLWLKSCPHCHVSYSNDI